MGRRTAHVAVAAGLVRPDDAVTLGESSAGGVRVRPVYEGHYPAHHFVPEDERELDGYGGALQAARPDMHVAPAHGGDLVLDQDGAWLRVRNGHIAHLEGLMIGREHGRTGGLHRHHPLIKLMHIIRIISLKWIAKRMTSCRRRCS